MRKVQPGRQDGLAAAAGAGVRLFYALWPDQSVRDAIARLPLPTNGRPTPALQYHVTLAFLGRQPVASIPQLDAILDRLPKHSMTLQLDRFAIFRRQRILWAGMADPPPSLIALQAALREALQQQSITLPPGAPFKPHVTLMRDIDKAQSVPAWAIPPLIWQVQEVALVASHARPTGVGYDVLASRRLDSN